MWSLPWIAFLVLCCYPKTGLTEIQCEKTTQCHCLSSNDGDYEFHCPPYKYEYGGVVMHVNKNKILIDGYNLTTFFDVSMLPVINASSIKNLEVRFCPLPLHSMKEILDKLALKEIEYLQYRLTDLANVTLGKQYFEGLENLKVLDLSSNDLAHLDEDVFENTPNLLSLDLQNNKIELKPGHFKYNPSLSFLDVASNGLQILPTGLFLSLKNLKNLHLWNNNITHVDDYTFEGLDSLKSLELSGNRIETVTEKALGSLTKLVSISLRTNSLRKLPESVFTNNTLLELVILDRNPNLVLPDYLFANLPHLKTVNLANCRLETIPSHIFEGTNKLETLEFSNNRLRKLPDGLFGGKTALKEINLNNNQLEDVPDLTGLKHLQKLNLMNNSISYINETVFKPLTDLLELNLAKNRITKIHQQAFAMNNKLTTIHLEYNQFALYEGILNIDPFNSLVNLESLYLGHNLITSISSDLILNKLQLRNLDLNSNRIRSVSFPSLQTIASYRVNINLANNNISTIDFDQAEIMAAQQQNLDARSYANDDTGSRVNMANNPINCDCKLLEAIKYFRGDLNPKVKVLVDINPDNLTCAQPPQLENLTLDKVKPEWLTCSISERISGYDECPSMCSCEWRPFDKTFLVDCSGRNLETIPDIVLPNTTKVFSQTVVHFERNFLTEGPSTNFTSNVTELYLSKNKIKHLPWVPPKLKILKLDNNNVSHLDYSVLERLNSSNLETVSLHNNPWDCNCEAENLTIFLRQNLRNKVEDANEIKCSKSNRLLVDLNRNDLCHDLPIIYMIVPILFILLISASSAALYYRYQQELKVWLFAKNLCLWWVTEEEVDKDKVFDAFISYSHKDEDFVTENLLPVLEPNYKLCLHYKHWIPGEFITKQICNSVRDSRRTLVVLSPNFLESVWGKMEFRTAHTEAMSEGRARVIVVLYNDVDIDSLDDELKTYLKTNTYVKWGDPHFWNKLKYALPHFNHNVVKSNQKHANVMSTLDDKFNLVPPGIAPNPGTTPPVLSMDTASLKKHPLNFVHSTNQNTPPSAEAGPLVSSAV